MSKIPENIIAKALETPNLSSAVVSAHQESLLESIKEASETGLIQPILIGDKEKIEKIAESINFKIKNFYVYIFKKCRFSPVFMYGCEFFSCHLCQTEKYFMAR